MKLTGRLLLKERHEVILSEAFKTYNIPSHPLHVKEYDEIIMVGTLFLRDEKNLEYILEDKEFISLSPMEDNFSKKAKVFGKYEAGTEEGVIALLLEALHHKSDHLLEDFLDELDIGYLSAESNIGEEEIEKIASLLKGKKVACLVGKDLEYHPKANNLAKLFGMLTFYCDIKLILLWQKESTTTSYKPIIAENIEELESFDGIITYRCFTTSKDEEKLLLGSQQFAISAKLKDGFDVLIKTPNNTYNRKFKIDNKLKGTIALLPANLQDNSYRYEVSKITQSRIENE